VFVVRVFVVRVFVVRMGGYANSHYQRATMPEST
jgi:hypothetical protein